jgi:hypothetical protein
MFQRLCGKYPVDRDLPQRSWQIARYRDVLSGTIYDCLNTPFCTEYGSNKEYIPVHERRPSVRYNLCRTVVGDSVSMLFSDGRFPQLHCADEAGRLALAGLVKETGLVGVMVDAALRGSVGSAVVRMRVLDGRVFFDVMDTEFLTPTWKATAPDTLDRVVERYKVMGADLAALGYAIKPEDLPCKFWFQRIWTGAAEEWYAPLKVGAKNPNGTPELPQIDDARTVRHGLGFVPMVWIKNLPGASGPDGCCTFAAAIDTQIEIEYQLSQTGRGLRYSSDPTLMIREPAGTDNEIVRSASNAIVVSEKGDAKLLEISGTAAEAVISYVSKLREIALESIHGNRSTPDKMGMAQSGRALELLHEPLIWLADMLRTSYGAALLSLVKMALRAGATVGFDVAGVPFAVPADTDVSLRWGHWFSPTHHDNLEEAQALQHHAQAGHISRKSAVMIVCDTYDLPDAAAEMTDIQADMAAADARAAALAKKAAMAAKITDTLNT